MPYRRFMQYLKQSGKLLAEEQLRLINVVSFPKLKEHSRREMIRNLTSQIELSQKIEQKNINAGWDMLKAKKGKM